MIWYRIPVALSLTVLVLAAMLGCGPGDGLSDYERQKKNEENAAEALKKAGAKIELKHYPQGDAWAVTLTGVTITDDTFNKIKLLDRISELDFSKSSITDAQLERVNDPAVSGFTIKLDLSGTAITDAGLDKLDRLPLLMNLNLKGSKVTPAGVQRFKKRRQDNPGIGPNFKSPTVQI